MDLGDQTHRAKFMIRDRGSNFTTAFDAVLADTGIRTVLCNVQTPRMCGGSCWSRRAVLAALARQTLVLPSPVIRASPA
jgi:putative transposase